MSNKIEQLKPLLPFIRFIADRRRGIEKQCTYHEQNTEHTVENIDVEKSKQLGKIVWKNESIEHEYTVLEKYSDAEILKQMNKKFIRKNLPRWTTEFFTEVCRVFAREIEDFPPEHKPVQAWKKPKEFDVGSYDPQISGSVLERLDGNHPETGLPHDTKKRYKRLPKLDKTTLNKFKSLLGHFERTEHPVLLEYGRSVKVFDRCVNAIAFIEEKNLESFRIMDAMLGKEIYVRGNSTRVPYPEEIENV